MSLAHYDLTVVFYCVVELAEATTNYQPQEETDLPAQTSPHDEEEKGVSFDPRHDALDAIAESSNRLKRALGAKGPLDAAECLRDPRKPTWEEYRIHFRYCVHPASVRQALYKLATAAIDLSGYAGVQAPDPLLRERGLRLLRQGLAQLWQGMTGVQRAEVQSFLPRTHAALGWPDDPTKEPANYDGPDDIAVADQYRVIDILGGFAARNLDFLEEQQRALLAASKWATVPRGYSSAAQDEVKRINQFHRLAVRCVNVVLRLHHLRHGIDGAKHGLAVLVGLREAIAALPPLPLAEDHFCRDEVIEVAGAKATSAHAAAFLLAQQTWDAVQLHSLGRATGSWQGEGEGAAFTGTSFEVQHQAPTEVPWSDEVWQKVCAALANRAAPDADWFQAALALERTQVSRRLNQLFMARKEATWNAVTGIAGETSPLSPPCVPEVAIVPTADVAGATAMASDGETQRNMFRLEGDIWTLSFAAKTIHLKDSLGLKYIAHLLLSKHQNIDAVSLRSVATGNVMVKPSAGIEILDRQALQEYKAEYESLKEQLEEAKEFNDLAKQEQLQSAINSLAEQLEAARGLGNRTRKVKDETANVRTSIKNAISRTIEKHIQKAHPELARHFDTFLRTGHSLCYAPDPDVDWEL